MPESHDRAPRADDLPALLDDVGRLLLDLAGTDLTEFEFSLGASRIHVRQTPGAAPSPARVAAAPAETLGATQAVRSPLNGVFYARPNPNAEVYVRAGDRVERDQVVCLVEAMKSFNEIRTELAGTVERVAVEDGQVVNAGDPLVYIVPDAESATDPGAG